MRVAILLLLLVLPSFAAKRCVTCPRDTHGRIKRDPAAIRKFRQVTPCPGTGKVSKHCAGYIVDHILALECGGTSNLDNLQFQTVADAKAKDRTESLCRK